MSEHVCFVICGWCGRFWFQRDVGDGLDPLVKVCTCPEGRKRTSEAHDGTRFGDGEWHCMTRSRAQSLLRSAAESLKRVP